MSRVGADTDSVCVSRYAQQARSIVNVARINEDPNVKMIRGEGIR